MIPTAQRARREDHLESPANRKWPPGAIIIFANFLDRLQNRDMNHV